MGTGTNLASATMTPEEEPETRSAIQYLVRPWELLYGLTMNQDQSQEWNQPIDKNRSQLMGPKMMSLVVGDPGIRKAFEGSLDPASWEFPEFHPKSRAELSNSSGSAALTTGDKEPGDLRKGCLWSRACETPA